MSVDLRRFDYALEPLLRQRRWKLDALQAELGRAQRRLEEQEREVATLQERLRLESDQAARGLVARLDPVSHPRALGWLVQLREQIRSGEAQLAELRTERDGVRAACLALQQKVDVIERHREECLAEYAQEETARTASEADRDWLTRQEATRRGSSAREGT